jgi:hypothetical protein
MDAPQQPTILVKKSDGTAVRMTLAEFQAMKKKDTTSKSDIRHPKSEARSGHMPHHTGKKTPHRAAAHPKHAEKEHHRRLKETMTTALSTTAPVTRIFEDEAIAADASRKHWNQEDAASPLEDSGIAPTVQTDTAFGSADATVEAVIKRAGWAMTPDAARRLSPLILSRVKDVRTDEQFLVHAMTPTHRGGAGLSPDQAEKLLSAIRSLIGRQSPPAPMRPPAALPPLAPPLPRIAAPMAKQAMHDIVPPKSAAGVAPPPMPPKAPPQQPQPAKPPVMPAERGTMARIGPKDEFASITLADFRRMGATTDAALSRMKEKFDTLKQESYMLFLDAREAWYRSPLYQSYIDIILASLRDHTPLAALVAPAGAKDGLTMEVVEAIAALNGSIAA